MLGDGPGHREQAGSVTACGGRGHGFPPRCSLIPDCLGYTKRLGIERARLTHLLDSLERRKLVKRIKSKTDRRSHALHLNAQGELSQAKFKQLVAEHDRGFTLIGLFCSKIEQMHASAPYPRTVADCRPFS
jgi:hypothetical protein